MSPSQVLEPTYHAIKQRLIDGAWPWGYQLEATKIATLLKTSVTPVRDSLHRLVGEHLVAFFPGRGFQVPQVNEIELRDLFRLNLILLRAAIADRPQRSPGGVTEGTYPDQISDLFLQLASRSRNGALVAAVTSLNERLHQFRRCEPVLFADLNSELGGLRAAAEKPSNSLLRSQIIQYHHRRSAEAAAYIRLMTPDSV